MALTFTATADSSTTIGHALYGSTTWNKGSTQGACQGAYQGTSGDKSRVGIMIFTGAGSALAGKVIQSIALSITCPAAGSSSESKVLTFHKSNAQAMPSGVTGSSVVGETLGTLTGRFYNNTVTHTLNASTNAALFNALAAYLKAGNSVSQRLPCWRLPSPWLSSRDFCWSIAAFSRFMSSLADSSS